MKVKINLLLVVGLASLLVLVLCGVAGAEDGNIDTSPFDFQVGGMAGKFRDITAIWWDLFMRWGKRLWWALASFDVIIVAVQRYAQKSTFDEIVAQWAALIFIACIPWWFCDHYAEYANMLYGGVMQLSNPLGVSISGQANSVGHPLDFAMQMVSRFVGQLDQIGKMGLGSTMFAGPWLIITTVFALFVSFFMYALCLLMELAITVAQVEFFILAPMGALFVGMASLRAFHGYGWQVLKFLIASCLKILLMQMIMDVGFGVVIDSCGNAIVPDGDGNFKLNIWVILNMLGMALLTLMIMIKVPGSVANLIGNAGGSGWNPVAAASGMAVSGFTRNFGSGFSASGGGRAVVGAAQAAGAVAAAPLAPIALAMSGFKAAGRYVTGGGGDSSGGGAGGANSKTAQTLARMQ